MNRFLPLILLLFIQCAQAQTPFNGGVETLAKNGKPVGWAYGFTPIQEKAFPVKLDSLIKQSGKYSLSIEKANNEFSYGVTDYAIPKIFEGKTIQLRGYMKTENVSGGYAGIWLRLDGESKMLTIDNMSNKPVSGTTDWKQYTIEMPYPSEAVVIHVGGLITGEGKAWFDSFEILIDGKKIDQAPLAVLKKAQTDTAFSKGSRIGKIDINAQQLTNLALTGQFWGFLKYHHTAVTKGDYNWDAELFRVLPSVITAKNNAELSSVLEKYLDKLPVPAVCKSCNAKKIDDEMLKPDYGELLTGGALGKTLTEKLMYIKNNRNVNDSYYIGLYPGVANPQFKNEKTYANMLYPDAGYRLLSLYRYWAMINYFFPYKHQIDQNWNDVLRDFIPQFLAAKDEKEYTLTTLKLIAKVSDTHANIWGGTNVLNGIKGKNTTPFQAKFIENKLIVTGYFVDTLNVKDKFKIGDEILAINGVKVADLIKKYLPITPASNYDTQLRDLPRDYFLRSNESSTSFTINSKGKTSEQSISLVNMTFAYKNIDYTRSTSFHLISPTIGYVYPGKYKNAELPAIEKEFQHTKGIVVDMRCYPSEFMPFTFGNYIKSQPSPFVKFTAGNPALPGSFTYNATVSNGNSRGNNYKGKVVVIVNATSQSQAEYTTMAFQSSPNVRVIGSTTAGADGNVSSIILPGGIATMISGIGVFYPDGTPTQRVGVKIDHKIYPTVKGISEGKDELLDKAIELLNKGW
ncbi:MAG: peptidase S41 [Chitinophagaceae bacterium]|nr:MAG: peptidase S41 [Chitinophagaceae bacterium]